jgi:hypothetical protein
MMFITGLLKQVVKGAAVQLGVSAVHEAVWPKVKKATGKLLDKAAELKRTESLETLIKESEDRAESDDDKA